MRQRRVEGDGPEPIRAADVLAVGTMAGWSVEDFAEAEPILAGLDRVWLEAVRERGEE